MVVVKPKIKVLPMWQQVIEESGGYKELGLGYFDQPIEAKFVFSSLASEIIQKHRVDYKWYGNFDDKTSRVNLYFPTNYFTSYKLYGVASPVLYLRYRAYRDRARAMFTTVIPLPYSVDYNDSIISLVSQVKPFDYNDGYYIETYEHYNDQLERLSLLDEFVLINDYVVYVIYDDHWVLITLDSYSVILVCMVYCKGVVVGLYLYVVSKISIDNELGYST